MRVITQQLQISIYGVLIGLLLYLNKSGAACPDGTFTCTSVTGQRCVPNSWICDGEKDCEDNADEHPSLCSRTVSNCTDTEFLCKTKWCIPMKWKCNGYDDCGDRSDELCDICSTAHFQCADLSACVPGPWRCDGEVDCRDRSDEVGCAQSCGVGYLSCHNNRGSGPICYTPAQRCNGIRDCQTGADEDGCLSTTTTPTARPTCDKSSQFDCLDNGRRCLPLAQVCDHFNDCGSNQDEAANVCWGNTCKVNNGGCESGCVYNSEQGQRCTCGTGYVLGNDSKSCLDVDECKEGLRCSQLCENTDGGYNCSCAEGYEQPEKSPDTCKASSGDIVLIVAAQRDIREIRLKSKETFQLIENLRGIVAVDFDVAENVLYWTEVSDPKIGSLQLTASHKDIVSIPEVLVNTNIDTPDGIAFDWVHKNLYWTDTGKNTVQVINVKSGLRKVLVREYLDEPRAIVVDPRDDYGPYMYWSDWGQNARIEKAGLDGSNRQKIVTENVHWPNGIAIDFPQNRLYWIDRRLQLIASTDLDGRSRHLLSMVGEDAQTFSMDIFQDSIFYSDWYYGSLFKANKRVPNETVSVRKLYGDPKGLRVFHALRQPEATDRCEGVNCSSLAMCVPSPSWPGYTCLCADNPPNRNQTCVPGVPVTTQSVDDDVTTDDLTTMTSEAETTTEQTSGSYRCRLECKVLQLVVLLVWTQMISRV